MIRRILRLLAAPLVVALAISPASVFAQAGVLPGNLNVVAPTEQTYSAGSVAQERSAVPAHLAAAFAQRDEESRQKALGRAIDAQERHTNALLKTPGTVGTAVSWNENNAAVIKVFVSEQGSAAGIPESLDGVPVVVEPVGNIFALNVSCERRGTCDELGASATSEPPSQQDWHPRPVPIGVSAGHSAVTAGTIGCRLTTGCHSYALSNAHVFADENDGVVGDNIIQPGAYDGGVNPTDRIGDLYASVPIVMNTLPSTNNRVDAAIAETTVSQVGTATRSDGYGEPKINLQAAFIGMEVMKYGRTTKQTYGYIDSINATVHVNYDAGTARFVEQVVIRSNNAAKFSRPGDSGSLIVRNDNNAGPEGANNRRPVGLLFASGDEITVANKMSDVLTELGSQISDTLEVDGEL